MNIKFYSLSYDERIEFIKLVEKEYIEKRRSISLLEAPNRKNIYSEVVKDPEVLEWLESHGCND